MYLEIRLTLETWGWGLDKTLRGLRPYRSSPNCWCILLFGKFWSQRACVKLVMLLYSLTYGTQQGGKVHTAVAGIFVQSMEERYTVLLKLVSLGRAA